MSGMQLRTETLRYLHPILKSVRCSMQTKSMALHSGNRHSSDFSYPHVSSFLGLVSTFILGIWMFMRFILLEPQHFYPF